MILIHVPQITSRVKYTCHFLFEELMRMPYTLTANKEEFLNSPLPKFAYGNEPVRDTLFFKACPLLFESDIYKQKIEFKLWRKLPVFFPVNNEELPFDLFAATFFLISRYEEYLPQGRDHHNRFRSEESTSYKGGFLDRPIINVWVNEFKSILKREFPSLSFSAVQFSFTPTVDIDNAYAYKYKGGLRITLNLLEKLAQFKFKKFSDRIAVHAGYRRDPYDSYEKLSRIHKEYKIQPLYFILLGDYGKYDRNLSPDNKKFIDLIKSLQSYAHIGLHPSYKSNGGNGQLAKEKKRLEKILGSTVEKSRQHYIKLEFPHTYRNLLAQGIKEDYSMGFPSKVGFRAGTSTPFYFFDLEKNETTSLKVFPFVMMDSTLKYYMKFRSKEVIPYMTPIVEEMKRVGGNFVFVFHNESLGEAKMWKNWGDMYEKIIRLAISDSGE